MLDFINTLFMVFGYFIFICIIYLTLVSDENYHPSRVVKFAFTPTIVHTWRGTKCIIWLQRYYVKIKDSDFLFLNEEVENGTKYINKKGIFSYEYI